MTQNLPLPFPGVTAATTGLTLPPGLPFKEWELLLQHLFANLRTAQKEVDLWKWYIADAIIYGEQEYGEMYAQAIAATGLSYQSLANIVWVGREFPALRRTHISTLSFDHHSKVAALPPAAADTLLDEAEQENWSTRTLYQKRLDREAQDNDQDPALARAERALGWAREAVEALPTEEWAEVVGRCLLGPLGLS